MVSQRIRQRLDGATPGIKEAWNALRTQIFEADKCLEELTSQGVTDLDQIERWLDQLLDSTPDGVVFSRKNEVERLEDGVTLDELRKEIARRQRAAEVLLAGLRSLAEPQTPPASENGNTPPPTDPAKPAEQPAPAVTGTTGPDPVGGSVPPAVSEDAAQGDSTQTIREGLKGLLTSRRRNGA